MKITFGQGLNADALSSELGDGFASDCSNFRFRSGFAEVLGGSASTGVTFTGGPNSISQLYTSTNTYIIGSTTSTCGAYTVGGSTTPTAITRKTEGAAISSATSVGTTVTITTATAHGRATGNTISVWGFTPTTYNAESVVITVTGATTFTYTVASAPSVSPATANGMYSVDATTSNVTLSPGGELNGVLILNSTSAGCYYWGGNTSIPVRKVVGSYTARASIPFGNFIVQLAPTISSVEYPFRICWSNASEPGSVPHNGFTSTATNQAGDVEHPEIGEMVWANPLGDDLIVYGTRGRLVMRYVGGVDVFSFTRLIGDEGLYFRNFVVSTPAGHVFVDRDRNVRIHDGGACKNLSFGRVQNLLGSDNTDIYFIVAHYRQNEVWIGYRQQASAGGAAGARFALIWNWVEDTWGKAVITAGTGSYALSVRTSSLSTNMALYLASGSSNMVLTEYDNSATAASTFSITREGMDAGDSDVIKNLQRSRWNIDSVSGFTPTYTVEHGSSMYADTAATYAASTAYTPGASDYANARATGGRFMAARLSGATSTGTTNSPYYSIKVRSVDLDLTTGGKR